MLVRLLSLLLSRLGFAYAERRGWLRVAGVLAAVCLGVGSARAATCTVTSTADDGSSGTLRYCLKNYSSGDTIDITATGTITLGSALPGISKDVTITGPGQSLLTISGANTYPILTVSNNSPSISISGVTLANGSGAGGFGAGGITYATGSLTVADTTFSGNSGFGGAIQGFGSLTVIRSTFSGNSSPSESGGAIFNYPSSLGGVNVTVSGSTFSGNSASSGGAIFSQVTGSVNVANSTFSNNSAGNGGALHIGAAAAQVTNSTFVGNSSTSGNLGAILIAGANASANNNLFVGNSGGAIDKSSGSVNGSNNVYYNNSGGDCISCSTGSAGSNGNVEATANPLALPLGNYGGSTQTYLPQPGSAAICAGSAALAVDGSDQRQTPVQPSYGQCFSGTVDAGAVQTNYIKVQSSGDAGSGTSDCIPQSANCTLRDAIAVGNSLGTVDVDFASGVSTINLKPANGTLEIKSNSGGASNLIGPGANQLTVNGNGSSSNRLSVFTVDSGGTATLSGMTVTGGDGYSTGIGGGGILNQGTLTVLNSAISGNTAQGNGGGIANSQGALTVENSTISGNTSPVGGGGGIYSSGTGAAAMILESTVYGNTAGINGQLGHGGGGIYFAGGTMTITGSTISGNLNNNQGAGLGGGGVYSPAGFTLSNSIVSGNTSIGSNDIDGSYTNLGGNVVGQSAMLSGLQYNGIGATVETLIPLPGSPAICAGKNSLIPSGTTTDERGYPLTTPSYCGTGQIDAGAVQTNYTSVAFVQQPTNTPVLTPISPAPTVEVLETDRLLSSNNTDAVGGIPVTVTPSGGTYAGSPFTATTGSTSPFVASFSGLDSTTTAQGIDLMTSPIKVAGSASLAAATSSTFNVYITPPSFTSANKTGFHLGANSFTVTTTGSPAPTITYFCPGNSFSTYGLTFTDNHNGTATISGVFSPIYLGASFTCTLTAANGSSQNATQSFTLSFEEFPVMLTTEVSSETLAVGVAATPFQPVKPATGAAPYTYMVSPTLPAGLSMNSSTGVISGTPTLASAAAVYTVTVTDAFGETATATFTLSVVDTSATYVVNSTGDDATGVAANCPANGPTSGFGNCTLRDAIAAASSVSEANIVFSTTVFPTSAQTTIQLTPAYGSLTVAGYGVTITGPGANLLTVNANGSSSHELSVFTVDSGATATLYGMTITGGYANFGGGVYNQGRLTVLASAVSGNTGVSGGGIENSGGALAVERSTISGNTAYIQGGGINSEGSAPTATILESTLYGNNDGGSLQNGEGGGGILCATGTMTIAGSTIWGNADSSKNSTDSFGGGIIAGCALTLSNSIVANNTSPHSSPNIANQYTDGGGNLIGGESSGIAQVNGTGATITMSGPQYNGIGATVETLIPLPGSPAICAGQSSLIPSGTTTDERGYPLSTPSYCSSGQVDSGAVQTNYTSVAFVQQPTTTAVSTNMSPAPTVEVLETDRLLSSNNTDAVGGIPVTVTPSGGTYAGAPFTATTGSTSPFVASFSSLDSTTKAQGLDLVTSAITVAGSNTLAAATSNTYNVYTPVAPTITSASTVAFPLVQGLDSFTVTTTGTPAPAISYSSCTSGGFLNFFLNFKDNGDGTATIEGDPQLHGGPVSPGMSLTCTLTATNGVNPAATQTFTIGFEVQLTASTSIAQTSLDVGTAATAFQPVTAANGWQPYTYTVSPALPAGLSLNAATGAISGTASATSPATSYTITVTDAFNATAQANFNLTVNPHGYTPPTERVLWNFASATGDTPQANLIQASDGNFYGTTSADGTGNCGTVFQLTPAGSYTVLHTFNESDGCNPASSLVQGTDGNLYGTTLGDANDGTIFKIGLVSPYPFTLMHTFSGGDGEFPNGLVQGNDGNFYGTTSAGGSRNAGTVFAIRPTAPYSLTVLHNFAGGTNDGEDPDGGLLQGTDGNLYGTTFYGGAVDDDPSAITQRGDGTVFKISPVAPYPFTLMHSFGDGTDGYFPSAGLVQGADGNLYGTTQTGGTDGYDGTVFKISTTAPYTETVLHSFQAGSNDGSRPFAGLVEGSDGNLYGTTSGSGENGGGLVFSINPSSPFSLSLLYSFGNTTTDGDNPQGGLVQGADGNFYGTTQYSGTNGVGVAFKLVSTPALAAPVSLSAPASVNAGASFTLSYQVLNAPPAGAAVGTLQQCFATNTAGDTSGWTGVKTGYATSTNVTLTAPTAPGTYTYTLTCGGMESNAVTVAVPTAASFGTMTFSPAATEPQGTSVAVTISDTVTYNGAQPSGAVTFTLNGVGYAATCTTAGSPETCSATVPAATIAALTRNSYSVTAALAADSVYAAVTGASGTFTVTYPTSYSAPTEPVGTASATQTATIQFSGTFTVGSVSVLTLGATGLDYNPASGGTCANGFSAKPSTTCTVKYTFTPKFAGARYGAIVVKDTSGNTQATVYLNGTGTGPEAVFNAPLTTAVLGGGFNSPYGVAVDGGGNVYVADQSNNAVKEIPSGCASSSCVLTLGGGFSKPAGIAVDGAGNVYVGDNGNLAVKEISPGCTSLSCVTTLVAGVSGPEGVAVDGSGNIYFAGGTSLYEIPTGCASPSCLTTLPSSTLVTVAAERRFVAVDGSGNVYLTLNYKVSPYLEEIPSGCTSASCVTTPGGGFGNLDGVAVDASGNIYVADLGNNVLKMMPSGCTSSSCVTTLATGFNNPYGVALDGGGNVYVGDLNNKAVKKLDRVDAPTLTFATATPVGSTDTTDGAQTATLANIGNQALSFSVPATGSNPSFPAGFVYDPASTCPLVATGSSSAGRLAAGASCALGVDFAPTTGGANSGSVVFTDNSLNLTSATQSVGLTGTGIALTAPAISFNSIAEKHTVDAPFQATATSNSPGAITYSLVSGPATVSASGLVTLTHNDGLVTVQASQAASGSYSAGTATTSFLVAAGSVWAVNSGGGFGMLDLEGDPFSSTAFTGGGLGTVSAPGTIAFDHSGNAWIASAGGVSEFNLDGTPVSSSAYTGGGIASPVALAVDGAGYVWIANANATVSVLNNAGAAVSGASGYPTTGTGTPGGLTIDLSGNVWMANKTTGTVTEMIGAATPVAPVSTALQNGTMGAKP
jgi:CSLREA domain-containing protein